MILDRLVRGQTIHEPVVLVVAHPDDEVVGAGSRLKYFERLTLIHVTDGAPKNLLDARAHGFQSADEYSAARRKELTCALRAGHARPVACLEIRVPDQEAAYELAYLARQLAATFAQTGPELILTHAYEGGHPDHDACAFAVHQAVRLTGTGRIAEITSYHRVDGRLTAGQFLNETEAWPVRLSPAEQSEKQQMLDCFTSQKTTLAQFSVGEERFRFAPEYDFASPPHPGRLHYEHYEWGMTGARFCELARAATRELHEGEAA